MAIIRPYYRYIVVCREAVRSAILATAWLLVFIMFELKHVYPIPRGTVERRLSTGAVLDKQILCALRHTATKSPCSLVTDTVYSRRCSRVGPASYTPATVSCTVSSRLSCRLISHYDKTTVLLYTLAFRERSSCVIYLSTSGDYTCSVFCLFSLVFWNLTTYVHLLCLRQYLLH